MSRPSKCVKCGEILKLESDYKKIDNKKYCLECAKEVEKEKTIRKEKKKQKEAKEREDLRRGNGEFQSISNGKEPISKFSSNDLAKEYGYYNCACGCGKAYIIRGKELRYLRDIYNPDCWDKMDRDKKARKFILNEIYNIMMDNNYTDFQFYDGNINAFSILNKQLDKLIEDGISWGDILRSIEYYFKDNNRKFTLENFGYGVKIGYVYVIEEKEKRQILKNNLKNNQKDIEKYLNGRKDIIIDVEGIRDAERLSSYREKIKKMEGHRLSDFVPEDFQYEDSDENIWE